VLVCLSVALGLPASAAAERELTISDLDWPASTRSARTRTTAKVYRGAEKEGGRLGKVAKGQRLTWTRIVKTRDRCRAWVEIEPRGWMCAKDLAPSEDAPTATAMPRKVLPGAAPSGVDLVADDPPGWPFGWALEPQKWRRRDQGKKRRGPRPTPVRADARADAEVVRTLEPRTVVAVLEVRDGHVRIGEGEWVAETHLRIARRQEPPAGVGADEPWIDVDLDQQVLISYRGETPVFAALISSGRRNGTPTGIYRVRSKQAETRMRDRGDAGDRWDRRHVPFVLRFRNRYAVHGAYWHDRFGNQESVGCVTLAPEDARRVYESAGPEIPEGWLEAHADEGAGTVVRIRSEADPDPAWYDYDGKRVSGPDER